MKKAILLVMSKYVIILFALTSNVSFSQEVSTKFINKGYLVDKPNIISKTICEFKKNKEVRVIEFTGRNWWKVNYEGCIGYVTSPFILIDDEVLKIKQIGIEKNQKESIHKKELIKFRKDSIMRRNDSVKRIDSIVKIKEKRRIDGIKTNIVNYAQDSLIYSRAKRSAKLKRSPNVLGEVILTLAKDRDVMILDYSKDYFKVCVDSKCGYMSEVFFNTGNILYFNMENELASLLMEFRKNEEKMEFKKKQIEKFGEKIYSKLERGYYWIGMTKEMARISLGEPKHDNRSVGSWGVHNQWVYDGIYLYFENGLLKSYQN